MNLIADDCQKAWWKLDAFYDFFINLMTHEN